MSEQHTREHKYPRRWKFHDKTGYVLQVSEPGGKAVWHDMQPHGETGLDEKQIEQDAVGHASLRETFDHEAFPVNALASIPTPALDSGAVARLVKGAKYVADELKRSADEGFNFNAVELRTLANMLADGLQPFTVNQ